MNLRGLPTCLAFFSICFWAVTVLTAHDGVGGGKGIGDSAPGGIGGDGPWNFHNITLMAHMPLSTIGGGPSNVLGNDIWGWTDRTTGREYALYGRSNGTSFIDITDATNPTYLGDLPTHTGNKAWRDIKVFNDHAYIVSDANGAHGMQIFDLTQLRNASGPPQTFSETGHYSGFNRAHNIAINEDTGYAYVVGANVASGGLHILDLNSDPLNPVHVGSFSADGYTHDTQVVSYTGPDSAYAGREIAFNANEDTLTIVDVTDKNNPTQIAREGYHGVKYLHQGWLSEDQRFFFSNDELDERDSEKLIDTITRVWNVEDLDNPVMIAEYNGEAQTIDHNNYTHNGYIFQANYTSGLRVLEPVDMENGILQEYGFFDTYNTDDNVTFNGAWSVFPYFDSGNFIVNDRQNGLFVLRFSSSVIPEPGTFGVTMLFLGAIGVSFRRRRRSA